MKKHVFFYCFITTTSLIHKVIPLKLRVWVIDQVRGQDGSILAKFFFCVFMDRDAVVVHKLAKKENEANIQPSWTNKLGQ